ncbi:MAG: hypothetical protein A2176_05790 [Spirochaetes bacterium RBG_13_51_14]|nr:MAG: hypothetical protein A2176_05790 [Spirochaetes bacterium RBG_13_51_14]
MSGIRIIAGELRGRVLPFANRDFDNADITPQKVKGALFSMIGEWLHGRGFLDLYAGSGQIGIEALSRGADPVVINEKDPKRFRFIKTWLSNINYASPPHLLNFTDLKALDYLNQSRISVRYVFLDPPYEKTKEGIARYRDVVMAIGERGILDDGGQIVIQHFHRAVLDETVGPFRLRTTKKYGRTSLSVYE